MTILVVDDDAAVRNSLRLSLESEGIEVELAAGPEDATRAISRTSFDAVVTDLSMPGNGEHVLEQVQILRPDLPVIVVTGELSKAKLRSVRRRAHALLTKPFRTDRLVRLLHDVEKASGPRRRRK